MSVGPEITSPPSSRHARMVSAQSATWNAARHQLPPWLGDPDFHRSHRSALVRKDAGHYRELFPEVPDDLDYVWPVRRAT